MHSSPQQPELLSPAGDWDALRAAVANGANAVYLGLPDFNARHRATNFTLDDLPNVMNYLHEHNVRGYVTFNTLIFSDELPRAVDFIRTIVAAGVDAVIVQDLGVAQLIHHLAPDLSVHGSTQMTLTEPRGIEFVHSLGVERVILARELSVSDVGQITQRTDVPVEVFVHGALCVSYSGQCLTSESLGGRSANRGQCAQACRLPYDLIVDGDVRDLGEKAYLLSPQDLAAYDLISDLLKSGVVSFKIEGRLKSAHYVAATTQSYRAALDAALQHKPFTLEPTRKLDLEQSFSRGFSHGFLDGVNHQVLVHGRFPKSRGVRIGTVVEKTEHGVVIELDALHARAAHLPIKPGDGLCFDEGHPDQDEQGGRVFGVRPWIAPPVMRRDANPPSRPGKCIEVALGHGDVQLAVLTIGCIVWKTDDPALRRRLEQSFSRDLVIHREPVTMRIETGIGQPLKITVRDAAGHEASAISEQSLEQARKYPLTKATAFEQLARLGDTPLELASVELIGPNGPANELPVMAPKSLLNDLRRQAVEKLLAQKQRRLNLADPNALPALREKARAEIAALPVSSPDSPELFALVRTLEQLQAVVSWKSSVNSASVTMVYCDFEDIRKYKDAVAIARAANVPIGLATTRIIKPGEEGLLKQVASCAPDAVLLRNLAGLSFFMQEHPTIQRIGDYALNVANELTAAIFVQQGLHRLVPSYDLNWKQLVAMLAQVNPRLFEVVIHQHMPMFHMEHCVFAHTLSDGTDHRTCGRPCDRHQVDLRDRVGLNHPLIADVGCRNTVYNGQAQSAAELVPDMLKLGLRRFRVEMLRESAGEATALLDRYRAMLDGQESAQTAVRQLRVLSQLGVTRGTFDFS